MIAARLGRVSEVRRSASSYARLTDAVPRVIPVNRSSSNAYESAVCPATVIRVEGVTRPRTSFVRVVTVAARVEYTGTLCRPSCSA